MKTSVVIPTYGREGVLVDTIRTLLALADPADEILVIDQTPSHEPKVEAQLLAWSEQGRIKHVVDQPPGVVAAMNRGLHEADGLLVLFLDDDIVPGVELVKAHRETHLTQPDVWAVVGQVLQPGQEPLDVEQPLVGGGLCADLNFKFNATQGRDIRNVMAGNLSVKRVDALAIGGFDECFPPPVAYRFETDFARRILQAGGRILFEPKASIRHLAAASGGTRSLGSHLTSASPLHGVGDYIFALRHGSGLERWCYIMRRPFREVRTKYHLTHPWWIPVKFVGEIRALRLAFRLSHDKSASEKATS